MNGIDAVLSPSLNPYTSGVAKFNLQLARRLGVPCEPLGGRYRHALISIKCSEIAVGTRLIHGGVYSLFLHDVPEEDVSLLRHAERIYAANATIAAQVREYRPDVMTAWCPSLVEIPIARASRTILTFGFAHKQQRVLSHYERLRDLLDATDVPYTILVSTGVHDGHPWDATLEESALTMRRIFAFHDRVEILGYLSDAALDREIRSATCCAAFYDPAWRANNTSAWSILERGVPLITNGDADSPQDVNGWYDITRMTTWPTFDDGSSIYQDMGRQDAGERYGWDRLVTLLRQEAPCVR